MKTSRAALGRVALAVVVAAGLTAPEPARAHEFKVLVYSEVVGLPHDSTPAGIATIQELAAANGFLVDTASDSSGFNDANLAQYAAVIWLSTTGDVLTDAERAAFERYIQAGGGYVGIHAAADTERSWAWYGSLVGAYAVAPLPGFGGPMGEATIEVADRVHPSSALLPLLWTRNDEWYDFEANPRGAVHVLATVDENTYSNGGMGFDHPVAWCHPYDGGRSWYTAGGHTAATFSEPLFRQHLLGGIQWAAGDVESECGGTIWANYQKVQLDGNVLNAMEMDIAPDGRVFFVERAGTLKIWRPDTQQTVVAGTIPVTTANEDGLLGVALDPNFAQNGWIYLYHSPPQSVPCGPANKDATVCGENVLSRFAMNGDTLLPGSQIDLLRVEMQRDTCCHAAGAVEFGPNGDLFLSTGDNTDPFQAAGFNPIDERPGRSSYDAQRSAANTNDLRGKILRIHPEADGSYTVPPGNLFAPGTPLTRPEIFAMGLRNPFRFDVDAGTGWVYVADYGPDAPQGVPGRGPAGQVEWNVLKQAVNLGWPYCHANNEAYNDYDFATNTPGPPFDCNAPVNESPNNTGRASLPPVQPAVVWYGYTESPTFPEMEVGSAAPMAGPAYYHDPAVVSDIAFPAYFDATPFFYEWGRGFIMEFRIDADGGIHKINKLFPIHDFSSPIDIEFGPDGALYVIEWGTGFDPSNDPLQELVRVEYRPGDVGNRAPVARASATPTSGPAPLAVSFSSEGSSDPDGDAITFAWDFESDALIDSTDPNPFFTYPSVGNYNARLTVTDETARSAVANVPITVGNARPVVSFAEPPNGGFFDFGDFIRFSVDVQDPEDGAIDCSDVRVQPEFGHAQHSHPLQLFASCEGYFRTRSDEGHGFDAKFFYAVRAEYTDGGGPGVGPLTGTALHVLQPKRKQAEYYDDQSGVAVRPSNEPGGHGAHVSEIEDGDWIAFEPIDLRGIDSVTYRWSALGLGGRIEVHVDAPDGPLISDTGTILPTGDDQVYQDVTAAIIDPGGTHKLHLVFRGVSLVPRLFNVNWIDFNGAGITEPDIDSDGVDNELDNCPFVANDQSDSGGISTTTPDGIGDACQCGDVSGNGVVNGQDANAIKRHGLGVEPNPVFRVPGNCDVTGNGACNGQDANAVSRASLGQPAPNFGQNCHNALGTPVPPGL